MDILKLNARELREKLLNNEITSRQIIEEYFNNIDKNEEDINAYISLDKELALEKADKIDKKIKSGEDIGLLAGFPISIKDNIMTKDFNTTAGSKMLENFKSPYNASIIDMIEEEDGIIIGKTNMDEFAMGANTNRSFFGTTRNPLDLNKSAGGSSGGAAGSVAGKEAIFGIGSDTGGSIRIPASYTKTVGLKPTFGRISRYGLIPMSNTLDSIGIIARDVLDTAYILNILSNEDEKDPNTIKSQSVDINKIENDYDIKGMKIAIPKQMAMAETEREVQTELSMAMKAFEDMGAIVEEVDMPILDYAETAWNLIASGDFSSNMARYDGIRYGYRADDYNTLDELYMHTRGEAFGEAVKSRILFGTYILSGNRGEEYYGKSLKVRRLIIDAFDELFKDYDIVLSLTSPVKSRDLNDLENRKFRDSESMFLVPANLAGLPAISIPGKVKGLSSGIQLMGNRFDEETIIKAALAYERMVK